MNMHLNNLSSFPASLTVIPAYAGNHRVDAWCPAPSYWL